MDQSGFQTLRLETERLMFGECRVEADVLSFLGFYEIYVGTFSVCRVLFYIAPI